MAKRKRLTPATALSEPLPDDLETKSGYPFGVAPKPRAPIAQVAGEAAAQAALNELVDEMAQARRGGRLLHRRYALLARQPFFRDATLPSGWAAVLNDLRDADERLCDRAALLTGALTAFRAFTDAIEPGSELPQR